MATVTLQREDSALLPPAGIGKYKTMSSCSHRLRPSFHGLTAKEAKAQSYISSAQMSEADSQEVIRPAMFHVCGLFTLPPTFGISSATPKFVSSSEFLIQICIHRFFSSSPLIVCYLG